MLEDLETIQTSAQLQKKLVHSSVQPLEGLLLVDIDTCQFSHKL